MINTVVISLGHRFRSDDGVGPYILDRVRQGLGNDAVCIGNGGDVTRLLEDWMNRRVYLVDAACTDSRAPGEVIHLNGLEEELPASLSITSSHGLNLSEAIELGKLMGMLPHALDIYAICGEKFSTGGDLSPAVRISADMVAEYIVTELKTEQSYKPDQV
ncbi:hydrogenase maturation protease [Microbulbifer rhizosphaerae]|uniref:Hydrogenase maturation protease n=1 Tax=Microbulbifer rhizosphaerae TaxID=1562603 RepID=A0A7W4W9I9_9GAMM|nr:hydrogenase maturation protease [Microbulbifer rhizosphaerae]